MSFDTVFKTYSRIRGHVKKQPTEVPYSFVTDRLLRVQKLFDKWLDIYELYAKGYQKELLSWSSQYEIWHLSICGNVIEETLPKVFETKIPKEVYILLNQVLTDLNHASCFYVVVEDNAFKQRSIYDEIYGRSLKNLTAPRPIKPADLETILSFIKRNDAVVFYYDRGEYDNALSWPLLIHECLHWFYSTEGIRSLEAKCPAVSWIAEALVDIYVTKLFGPAYTTSLASYLYLHPHEEAITHPHFAVRLYASSRYLYELTEFQDALPSPINTQVVEARGYIDNVLKRNEEEVEAVSKDIDRIYEETKKPIQKMIARKTQPFSVFIRNNEQERRNAMNSQAEEFPKRQIFNISDV